MTQAVIAYRGLPGCGKTTLAAATVAQARASGRRAARVSRDDVRRALSIIPGQGPSADEEEVTRTQLLIIAALIAGGVDLVVVDDTNLRDEHLSRLASLATGHGCRFEVRDLREVPLELCIQRDALRTGTARVGRARILEMAALAGLLAQPGPAFTNDVAAEGTNNCTHQHTVIDRHDNNGRPITPGSSAWTVTDPAGPVRHDQR